MRGHAGLFTNVKSIPEPSIMCAEPCYVLGLQFGPKMVSQDREYRTAQAACWDAQVPSRLGSDGLRAS